MRVPSEGGNLPVKRLPARLRFLSILRSRRVWNLSSPARPSLSRTIPVTFPVRSSQVIPSQLRGHAVVSSSEEGFHESKTRPSGSVLMPFLNSSRDRSSGWEPETGSKCATEEKNNSNNNSFIGLNVVADTLLTHSLMERETERDRERERNPRRSRRLTSSSSGGKEEGLERDRDCGIGFGFIL